MVLPTIDVEGFRALDGVTLCIWIVVGILVYAVNAWLLGRVFHKAGVARWKAWVPIINTWKIFNIGGHSGFCIFLGIISTVLGVFGCGILGTYVEGQSFISVLAGMILVIGSFALLVFYLYAYISSYYNIQKKLGKPLVFLVLAVINIIAPVWLWILALDHSKWNDKKGRKMIK